MAGRRLREAVKETLISNGNGEFGDDTHIVIAGLTNTYSQYVATFEEYSHHRYEVHYYTTTSVQVILSLIFRSSMPNLVLLTYKRSEIRSLAN